MVVVANTSLRRTNETKDLLCSAYRLVRTEQLKARYSGRNEKYMKENKPQDEDEEGNKLVCVTSGASSLGLAIVKCLLNHGYPVRVAVDKEEDIEKLKQLKMIGEGKENSMVSAITMKATDLESLCNAFNGCGGVFHTSAFLDPAGVSGYTKNMVDLEVKASENVMEACARTTIRKCVFTSSLLACVWQGGSIPNLLPIIDHNCWSQESICRDKKLWLALGKTMAERAAWRMAEHCDVKLATICPGVFTGPNAMSSVAYLKGSRDMYADGLLATADLTRVADAHVCVYKLLTNTAHGRYICFDKVIRTEEEAVKLASEIGVSPERILGDAPMQSLGRFKLCNRKILRLMSKQSKCR